MKEGNGQTMNGNDLKKSVSEGALDRVTAEVIAQFAEFCAIPHGSQKETEITEYLCGLLTKRGYSPSVDGAGNLICDIPPSEGCENSPLTVLQGHVDMVCAAQDDSWSPDHDPVSWQLRTDESSGKMVLSSDGRSSLGADCGLGNAVILWALFYSGCKHGPLRLLFTTEEEIGLVGAKKIDPSVFDDASYVINVDGFSWGRFIGGSAGGCREDYEALADVMPFASDPMSSEECLALKISLTEFHGGHSGYDIDKGRANTIKLLSELLTSLEGADIPYRVSEYHGGVGNNVIPANASAVIILRRADLSEFQKIADDFRHRLAADFALTDPDGRMGYTETPVPGWVLTEEWQSRLVRFIGEIRSGVVCYMDEAPEVVDTSSNLGVVRFSAACDEKMEAAFCRQEISDENSAGESSGANIRKVPMSVMSFSRSMTEEYWNEILDSHRKAAERNGFHEDVDSYGIWRFDSENPLLHLAADIYREITGEEPEITAVHVGLEPSAFCEKAESLQMINAGADIIDAHSVHERVNVDTIRPFAFFMKEILERIAEQE